MVTCRSILVVLATLAAALASHAPAAAQQRYQLVCEVPAGTPATFKVARGAGGLVVEAFIDIRHGEAPPGDGRSLRPGECAWSDRGMRPDEPNRLAVLLRPTPDENAQIYFECVGGNCRLANYFSFASLAWFEHTLNVGGLIVVDAYANPNARALVADGAQTLPVSVPPARGP